MQGITVLDRPHEIATNDKYTRFLPFVSTVTTNLNPLGLPPIKKEFFSSNIIEGKRVVKENPIHKRNRRIIKKLEKLNQIEKQIEDEELKKQLKKKTQVRNFASRINKEIEDVRKNLFFNSSQENYNSNSYQANNTEQNYIKEKNEKSVKNENNLRNNEAELQGNNNASSNNNNNSGKFKILSNTKNNNNETNNKTEQTNDNLNNQTNNIKENPKYKYVKERLEKANEKEIDELVNFAQSLDYDKYIKELETREALNLVKIKFDEENAKNEKEQEKNNINNENNEKNTEVEKENKIDENEIKDKSNLILPPIESKEVKEAEHIRDWGVRKLF